MFFKKINNSIERIQTFRQSYNNYLVNDRALSDAASFYSNNTPEIKRLRSNVVKFKSEVNEGLSNIMGIVSRAGLSTSMFYSPPPAVGGISGNIDYFANIFQLSRFQQSPDLIFDTLDRAEGVYLELKRQRIEMLKDPLFYLSLLIRWPFYIIKFSGFDSKKAEQSVIGKIYKFLTSFVLLILSIITSLVGIFQYIGLDFNNAKTLIKGYFS